MESKAKGRAADGRLGVSLSRSTADALASVRNKLITELGVELSLTQTIDYLVKFYYNNKGN